MKLLALAAAVCTALVIVGCGGSDEASLGSSVNAAIGARSAHAVEVGGEPRVVVPNGSRPEDLVVRDLRQGGGVKVKGQQRLTVWYVGLHWNGKPIESTWDGGKPDPFTFVLHNGIPEVIPGWERGIPGMRVGGIRELIVPPKLASGLFDKTLGPGDDLVYVVGLLRVLPYP